MPLWKKIDMMENPPTFLTAADECYYARDYVAGGGFSASEANQLISNLKKSRSTQKTPQWNHKCRAVRQFASELSQLLPVGVAVSMTPTSKCQTDPEYDPRLDMVLEHLEKLRPDIVNHKLFTRPTSQQAMHKGGPRSVASVKLALDWIGFSSTAPPFIVLIDDVLTCGTHFCACKEIILNYHPTIQVIGVFWARTTWPEVEI